jgi:hypothetical protein
VNQFTFAPCGDCYACGAGDFRGLATGAAGTRYFEPDGVALCGLPRHFAAGAICQATVSGLLLRRHVILLRHSSLLRNRCDHLCIARHLGKGVGVTDKGPTGSRVVYRPAKLVACKGLKNEIRWAVSTLLVLRERDCPDVGVPIYTQSQRAACLLRQDVAAHCPREIRDHQNAVGVRTGETRRSAQRGKCANGRSDEKHLPRVLSLIVRRSLRHGG